MGQGISQCIGTHHHQAAPLPQEPLPLQLLEGGRDANPACADHAGKGLFFGGFPFGEKPPQGCFLAVLICAIFHVDAFSTTTLLRIGTGKR